MENVTRSRPQRASARRPFLRRLIAPVVSLALLSGGGWGAYHYYGVELPGAIQPTDTLVAAHGAAAANDELKILFASEDKPVTPLPPTKPAALPKQETPAKVDRYAMARVEPTTLPPAPPQLPPLAAPPQHRDRSDFMQHRQCSVIAMLR